MGTNIFNYSSDQTYGLGAAGMNLLPIRVAEAFLAAKRNRGQIINACNLDIGKEIASGPGKTIIVPKAQHPAGDSQDLTDGAAPTLDDTTEAGVALTLNHLHTESFAMTDVAATIASPVAFDSLVAGRMATLLNTIEKTVAAAIYAGATGGTAGTINVALEYETCTLARQYLADNLAPNFDTNGFLAPSAYKNCLEEAQISQSQNQGSVGNLAPVALGRSFTTSEGRPGLLIGGHPWFECQAIESVETHVGSGDYQKRNLLFHKDAYVFASRAIGGGVIEGVGAPYIKHMVVDGMVISLKVAYDPVYLSQRMYIQVLWGGVIGRGDWAVKVPS